MKNKKVMRCLFTTALCLILISGCGDEKPPVDPKNPGNVTTGDDNEEEDPGTAIRDSVLEQLGNNKNDSAGGKDTDDLPGEEENPGSGITYDYDGTTLTINGHEMDINSHISNKTDRIMDCQRVGDWIIANCHINPQVGLYAFYNISDLSEPAYEIIGNDLTWRDDDLSTAVYSSYNEIYDFRGNMIGFVQDGEVYDLKWIDDTTIGAECWIVNEAGRELVFTEEFEYKPEDSSALYPDEVANDGGNPNESANSGGYTDVELCTMAAAYYKDENGYEPPYVDVDQTNGDMVTLHLYEMTDGHTATYAWYEINRVTGQGEDLIFGGVVDLTPFE